MRLLGIDIETSPNLAHVWGLWDQNVSLNQLLQSTEMLSFASKWIGEKPVEFHAGWHRGGRQAMTERAHALLDQADAVLHFNGKTFDVPHLNREFLEAGLKPPSPYKQIDLLTVVKKQFKLPSNKLAYVSKWLGLEGKVTHEGHELWIKVMAGDPKARARFREYNIQDVALLEDAYYKLLPWINNHPNVALYGDGVSDVPTCPKCGSATLRKEGFRYTAITRFQQYQCRNCGAWSSTGKRESAVDLREVK